MNKLVTIVFVVAVAALGIVSYWYINPRHMPSFLRNPAPGFEIQTPTSPVSNFQPPKF